MKKVFTLLCLLFLHLGIWANGDTTTVAPQNELLEKTELSANESVLKARVELLEKHESWTLTMLGIGLAVTAIILGLIQWLLSVRAQDAVYRELALIANQDKDAFKKSLKVKAVEMELTTKYPIYIITDQYRKNDNASIIQKLLRSYDFEQVKKISYNQANEMKFCERSVVVFCDDPVNETRDKTLVKQLLENTPKLGVFGYAIHYKEDFKNIFKDKGCISFALFPSQVYNNLLSLLHYKRYLNRGE